MFSSALVLYGMSWLYGAAGTTNLTGIAEFLQSKGAAVDPLLFRLALALLVAGLSFRITAVPFHFYAPDVFQGVAISNAAMLSFIPKVVGFVALVRLIPLTGSTGSPGLWVPDASARTLLAILATVTMFLGNLMALRQKNLHRLLAYSSIAHAGYMLVGLAAGNVGAIGGTSAVLFYLATYGLMTIGVFALLRGTDNGDHPVVNRDDLRGLSRVQPLNSLLMSACLLSLMGLPPTAGFLGKLNLFLAAWTEGTRMGHAAGDHAHDQRGDRGLVLFAAGGADVSRHGAGRRGPTKQEGAGFVVCGRFLHGRHGGDLLFAAVAVGCGGAGDELSRG